jgi:hypothetical protein
MVRLSEKLATFLDNPRAWGRASTVGDDLLAHLHLPFGAFASEDRSEIVCLIPEHYGPPADNLRAGQPFAMTWTGERCVTYQYKGRIIEARSRNISEQNYQRDLIRRMMDLGNAPSFDERMKRNIVEAPSWSVRFSVEAVFDQTPGPGAGKRIEL